MRAVPGPDREFNLSDESRVAAAAPLGARYRARFARSAEDISRAQKLRFASFRRRLAPDVLRDGRDRDAHDARCRHVLIEDTVSGAVAACFRLFAMRSGHEVSQSYAAAHYDLSRLSTRAEPMLEIGRLCLDSGAEKTDVLRLAMGALTRIVDTEGHRVLFGCSSFPGADVGRHGDALAYLHAHHLGPSRWRPVAVGADAVRLRDIQPSPGGRPHLPPLLRSYLATGAWVGDHVVIDGELDTLHVFTCVETARVPASRRRVLRALADQIDFHPA